jgi:peptidylprolyl isomerase
VIVHRRPPTARTRSAALLATLCISAVLAGCATSGNTGADAPSVTTTTTDLSKVSVTGDAGNEPSVKVPAPFSVKETERRVLSDAGGDVAKAGYQVSVDYVCLNGTDGNQFETTYGKSGESSFLLDSPEMIKGFSTGLAGANVGSRVVVAIPPKDAYGTTGFAAAGIGPTDTLVCVIDLKKARKLIARAEGTAVKPKKGLPAVTLGKSGEPDITVPTGKAPTKLVAQPLIAGTGPKVAKGNTITVHYKGVVWPGGKEFDSSWKRKSPTSFKIGVGQVIPGWDTGLVGVKVGSQMLLVIPPDEGYGVEGKPEAGLKGTDTLVFVVDVLDAS